MHKTVDRRPVLIYCRRVGMKMVSPMSGLRLSGTSCWTFVGGAGW